jgi:NitT/TauT family transport system substrate-binding protein
MRTRQIKAIVGIAAAAALCVLAAGCGSGGTSASSKPSTSDDTRPLTETVKMTYLYTPALTVVPAAFVAQAKGYFKDEHLDVTMTPFTGDSATVVPLLATGKVDAIGTSASPGFFNGIANNTGVKFVLSGGNSKPGAPTSQFLARANGPVKTIADLKGKKVALVGGTATVSGYYLSQILAQGGLTLNDVEVVNLDFPSGLAALKTDAVALALQTAPTYQNLVKSGDFIPIGNMDPLYAQGSPSGIILGPNLLSQNRRAGIAFIRALQRAASTDLQGDYLQNADTAKAIADGLGTTVAAAQVLNGPAFDPALKLNPLVFTAAQKFWVGIGALTYKTPLAITDVIDQGIVDSALKSKTTK